MTKTLKQLREEGTEWSIESLAEECGVSRQTLYNWESGTTCPKVRLDQFLVYCDCLGIDLADLQQSIEQTYAGDRPIEFVR